MPTQKQVNQTLKNLSFPVEFDHVPVGTKTPFGEYSFSITPVSADNSVLIKGFEYSFRVYMTKLDQKIFNKIEAALAQLEIVWTMAEPTYIQDSKCYQVEYDFGFIGDSDE